MSTRVQQPKAPPVGTAAAATLVLVVLVALALRPPFTAVAPLLEQIQLDLGVSNTFGGVLTTLPVVCLGAFAFVAPKLRQRFGDEKVLVGCLLVLLVGDSLRALGSIWTLLAGTVVAGAGIAVANVALPGLIKRDFPHKVPMITAVYTMCLTLGGAIAASVVVPIGAALASAWRAPLGLLALPVLLALVISLFALRRSSGAPPLPSSGGRLWNNPLAWQVTVFMGVQSAMAYVTFGWLPTMLQSRGMDPELAGLALGIQAAVQAVGSMSVPVLCHRLRDQRLIAVVLTVLLMLGFTGILVGPTAALWPAVVGLGLAQGAGFGLALTLFGLRSPDSDTTTALSGMAQGGGYLIAAAGPLLIGLLHEVTGGWIAPLVLLLACSAAWLWMGLLAGRPVQVPSVIGDETPR
ncbi:CynX/NimT family MFS transporter [Saccharopolyspora spinosa]|uniref:CP family cyanate transporter-like MFS transporter n=1 Tax=Saccharopolyspora spinosa TaxID=60894 RepID=A0A2N3Y9J8_SACSN|nr:MFS transporter [Saccharopolyspora spinosa]PKW19599.1 CP family cyanate transporter-like MFS transporter [Saccharopolyspora spinosa]